MLLTHADDAPLEGCRCDCCASLLLQGGRRFSQLCLVPSPQVRALLDGACAVEIGEAVGAAHVILQSVHRSSQLLHDDT